MRRYGVRYHRLCPDPEGIRGPQLARYAPVLLKNDLDSRSHILVAGLIDNWQQIVAQLIVAGQDHPSKRPLLTFIADADEAAAVRALVCSKARTRLGDGTSHSATRQERAFAGGGRCFRLAPAAGDTAARCSFAKRCRSGRHHAGAATTRQLFGTGCNSILVRQSKEDRLLPRLGVTQVPGRDMSKSDRDRRSRARRKHRAGARPQGRRHSDCAARSLSDRGGKTRRELSPRPASPGRPAGELAGCEPRLGRSRSAPFRRGRSSLGFRQGGRKLFIIERRPGASGPGRASALGCRSNSTAAGVMANS